MVVPEVRLMEAAIAVAEELNVSRAAKRLRIDQSTLSRRLVEAEELAGARLFIRVSQGVELTDAGRVFVEDARSCMLLGARAVYRAAAIARGAESILYLGRPSYVDPYLITALLSVRLPLFSKLKIKQATNYSHELAHDVSTGKLDVALVVGVPDLPELTVLNIANASTYIAMPSDSPLRHKDELRLEHLRDYEWIIPAPHVNPYLYEMLEEVRAERKITPPDVHHFMVAEQTIELMIAHKAVAFLTRGAAWNIARDGFLMRPLAEERLRQVTKLVSRVDNNSRLIKEFVRATGRKLTSTQPQQGRLSLAA